jgi:hypothetical protein
MRRATLAGLLAAAPVACGDDPTTARPTPLDPPNSAASVFTDNQSFPIELTAFVPCANGGAGEDVVLRGTLHELVHVTMNDAGHVSLRLHDQPQGVKGIGQVTGTTYQGTGVTQESVSFGRIGITETHVNNFRLIGRGPGNNLTVHDIFHVTINAKGDLKVLLEKTTVDCK